MLDTTWDHSNRMDFKFFVGKSRTGDQLHKCTAGSVNAHCNQRMKLRAVTGTMKIRPGKFCIKCFGDDPTGANPFLVETEIVA